MHRRDFLSATAATAAALHLPSHLLAAPAEKPLPIEYIDPDPATGSSKAVVVGPDIPFAHSLQFEWSDEFGNPAARQSLKAQVKHVFDRLDERMFSVNTRLAKAVKLNIVLRNDDDAPTLRRILAEKFSGDAKPAVSFVSGQLREPNSLVAIDAVVACTEPFDPPLRNIRDRILPGFVHIQPPGPSVYVSGQAEKGDLLQATQATLESLHKTLQWMSLDLSNAMHVKSFLTPMAQVDSVAQKIRQYFQGRTPSLSFVEWKSTLPIEIELVADAAGMKPPSDSVGPIEYLTPPGMTASPVFSRVTRVWSDRTIYTSGLYGREGQDAEGQVRDIFAQLEDVLKKAGSDLRHMAKATYYVSTEEASTKLGAIRTEIYDPKRPPAASKAMVAGVGMPGRSIAIDMIAVPSEQCGP